MSRMIYKDVIIIVESNNIFESKQQHINDKINKLEIYAKMFGSLSYPNKKRMSLKDIHKTNQK